MINFLKKGIIPIGAYCAPQVPKDGLPNRITVEQYMLAKECGVNIVYGHSEVIGTETEEYVFKALDCAEKAGIKYLVRDEISKEYMALDIVEGYKPYKELSEKEKKDLDERFAESLKRYCDYPAFEGISFADEPGYDSLDGIADAKKVFDRVCPDKMFYVNMYPYYITPKQYQYGVFCDAIKKDATMHVFDVDYNRKNIYRYMHLYEGFIEKVKPEFYSYDAYPCFNLGPVKTCIHEILWDLPTYLHNKEVENGIPFAVFLQAGRWADGGGTENVRNPSFGEARLGVSVPLLFGAKCLQIYPYMYPNDLLFDVTSHQGVIDKYGNKTEFFDYFNSIFAQVRAIDDKLIKSKLKGIIVSGEYRNNLPSEEELQKVEWNDTIYRGGLPELDGFKSLEIKESGSLKKVESDPQTLTGCLDTEGAEAFFVVNNSATERAKTTLYFDKEYTFTVISEAKESTVKGREIKLELSEGDNALIIKK